MAKRGTKPKQKTFSIRLPEDDYRKLKALAEDRRPQLTVQYVVEYAVLQLLASAESGQLDLSNPLKTNRPK